jgi:hypothetical protein
MPTIASMLYPGCTARIIGHTELWIAKGHNPRDVTRWPGYDQQNPADIAAHCKRLKAIGIDVLMFNTYAIGSWENKSLELYIPETNNAGLNFCINIDKGIYDGANRDPLTEIRKYMKYLRTAAFAAPNYEKWKGKFIVTYFALPSDSPAVFRTIESENPDCEFVYNDQSKGRSQMSWIHSGLEASLDAWCQKYAKLHDGGLYIPHVSPGFNDTFQGHSVWNTNPPRVYPAEGPNAATLKKHFDVLNKYYSAQNPLAYLQLVTVNDWDELTAIESKADGSGGYFSVVTPAPSPVPVPVPVPLTLEQRVANLEERLKKAGIA